MNYSEMKRRTKSLGYRVWETCDVDLDKMTGILYCRWTGCLETLKYPVKLSPEYVECCRKLNTSKIFSASSYCGQETPTSISRG